MKNALHRDDIVDITDFDYVKYLYDIDRLMLDKKRIAGIAEGCRQVAALPDPVGEVLWMRRRPNGLNIGQKRVPMGVIGIIYEARPNVTVDAAALCFKAGSSCILRGGKEAFRSSMCLTKIMREALASCGLPENAINLVEDTSRETATQMMKAISKFSFRAAAQASSARSL